MALLYAPGVTAPPLTFPSEEPGRGTIGAGIGYPGGGNETVEPATVAAVYYAQGLDVTVSTKFWCEHMGLPFHPTAAEPRYRQSRYSFGAMLAYPRDYHVVYRLWSVGSQRLPASLRRVCEEAHLTSGSSGRSRRVTAYSSQPFAPGLVKKDKAW